MKVVMKLIANEAMNLTVSSDTYLKSCDFEAANGRGRITTTQNKNDAMLFEDFTHGATFWKTQSTVRPFRPDGKPNRPLTAYSVTFENAE